MPRYRYKAVDKSGKNLKGAIDAQDSSEAIAKIKGLGLYPISVDILKAGGGFFRKPGHDEEGRTPLSIISGFFSSITPREMTIFSRQLSTLIDAGLPLVRSLHILKKQQKNPRFKAVIDEVAKQVESGSSFSAALAQHPRVFSKLFISTVKAGESAGILDTVLSRLADSQEKNDRLKQKIKGALTYPIAICCITLAGVLLIVTFIVPQFTTLYADMGAELPAPTTFLINVSRFLIHKWYLAIIFFAACSGAAVWLSKIYRVRKILDRYKLKIPVFGDLTIKYIVARFARTLGTLVGSGVSILQALEITKDTTDNILIENSIQSTHDSVKEGELISTPLEHSGLFPDMVTSMIHVGEETGSLEKMLAKVAEAYEDEVDTTVNSLTSLLEPILIVFMGIVVGGIIITLFLPLVKLMTTMSL